MANGAQMAELGHAANTQPWGRTIAPYRGVANHSAFGSLVVDGSYTMSLTTSSVERTALAIYPKLTSAA